MVVVVVVVVVIVVVVVVVVVAFNVISVAEVIIYGYEVIIATLGTLKTSCLVNFPCQIRH